MVVSNAKRGILWTTISRGIKMLTREDVERMMHTRPSSFRIGGPIYSVTDLRTGKKHTSKYSAVSFHANSRRSYNTLRRLYDERDSK